MTSEPTDVDPIGGGERSIRIPVDLPTGLLEVSGAIGEVRDPWAAIAVTHGAGTNYDHPGVTGFAAGMRAAGVTTLRFNLPYVEQGRRMPGSPAHAQLAWKAAERALLAVAPLPVPLWAAGRSYGGRMASMAAAAGLIQPSGLIYLGYPLHPPGRPEKPRTEHLPAIVAPQVFVTGTVDPFSVPHSQLEQAVASCQDAELVWVEGAGHSFEVKGRKRSAYDIAFDLAAVVAPRMRARR